MKRQLLGVAAILLSISTYAQDNPLWMRYCAISPDGTTIAFTYKGDIYTVPSTGVQGQIRNTLRYTIVEERSGPGSAKGWGRLKAGGWVAKDWVKKV